MAMLERSVGHQASRFRIPGAREIYFVWEYFGEPNTFWWVGQMLFCGANTFGGENTFGGQILSEKQIFLVVPPCLPRGEHTENENYGENSSLKNTSVENLKVNKKASAINIYKTNTPPPFLLMLILW